MSDDRRAVLITGCSSGIGRATAAHLAGRGWRVYASARRPETIADLAGAGCTILALDVTDEGSMREAAAGSRSPAAASTTRPSTRWRPSATRCASRSAGSAST